MWAIHTMEYYSATKNQWTTNTFNNMDGPQNNYAEGKNPDLKDSI